MGLRLQLEDPNEARGLETTDVSASVWQLEIVAQLLDLDLSSQKDDPDPKATVKMRPGSVSSVDGARCGKDCFRGARAGAAKGRLGT